MSTQSGLEENECAMKARFLLGDMFLLCTWCFGQTSFRSEVHGLEVNYQQVSPHDNTVDNTAVSHVVLATREAGAVTTSAEVKKSNKYEELARTHHVAPLAIETSDVFDPGMQEFVTELGRRLIRVSGDPLARSHMTQQISVAVQRGNAASVPGTFEHDNPCVNYNYI